MSGSTPGAESALVKVATPSPSPLAKLDVDFTCTKFEMHPSLSEEERRFYMKMYPYVDLVNQRKVHCTVCKLHLGTAPASDSNIRMHPILRVTHCVKCHDFYNSGEFSKGEDGSELYCRWCGQGGEVYCCSTCPYVFCKSCIVKNLSKGVIVDIEQNEHWNCFSCTSKILWPLRAQHWALVNYIQTQKRALQSLQLPEVEARRHMLKDNSNCCRLAKSKTSSLSDSMESLESNVSKRSHASSVSSTKRGSMPKAGSSGPLAKRSKPSNDEVVCTPDLLSMLEPDCQLSVQQKPSGSRQPVPAANITTTPRIVTVQQNYQPSPSSSNSNGSASGSSAMSNPRNSLPPPLVLSGSGIRYRQPAPGAPNVVRRTVVPNSVKTTGPVFHTINGFRVDLNSAAQQDSYRLPNGRLIQVKRQMPQAGQPTPAPPPPPPTVSIPSGVVIRPRPPIPANRPAVHISNYGSNMGIYNPQTNQQQRAPHVRVGNANQVAPPLQGPPLNANGGQTLMITPAPLPTPPPKAPTLVRQSFPNTPMGQARAQLQEQIFSAMDICTHLTGKVLSLTHSNAYNQVRNFMELKELYIHMSYLMTYAIGRFKNLQEKCLVDMREKGFKNDANSLENGQLAAAVDYVCYGQLDDVDLFNTGCSSFHNQVYEYRKSLHANLKDGEDCGPLPPLMPLGVRAEGDPIDEPEEPEEVQELQPDEAENEKEEADDFDYDEPDDLDDDLDDDDLDNEECGELGTEESMNRNEQAHAYDRKLTRLLREYPSLWCTRHPDYGKKEVTNKQWRVIATHFPRGDNIKLRWKNVRKRYVRIERRLKQGKRFKGYFDKATNYLENRDRPRSEWLAVDCGEDDGDGFERKHLDVIENTMEQNIKPPKNPIIKLKAKPGSRAPVRPLEVRSIDQRIITFAKSHPVLWRKSADPEFNSIDEQTRKSLWQNFWKSAPKKQASDDEDNEIEIVEPKTDTITIDSDNEDDTPSTSTQPPQQKAIMKITSVTSAAPKKEQREAHNQVDIDVAAFSSTILASLLEVDIGENTNRPKSVSPGQKKQPRKKTTNKPNPALLQLERQRMEDMKKFDAKLKKKVVIKLRRAEEEFEVARKWKEECRKQAQLAAERKNSVAEKDPSLEAEGQQSMEPEETSSLNAVEEKEPKDKEETESPNEQNAIKKVVEVDKEKIKSKEKIGDLLKAAIKAKIGETEKQLTEEKLTQEQSIKTKEAKTSEEQLASKEIEKEIEADNEITLTKDKKNEENKNASQNVLKKDEQVNSKESPSTSEMTEVSEKVSEKELSPPKEKVSKSDTAEMEVDLQTILDKKKTDQKEQKDVTEETTEKDLNPTIIADNEKKSPEKTSDAEISEIDELKEKEMETEISEDKEKPEESKDSAENCEKDSSMNSEKDSAEDTEEVAEKSVEEEKVIESEPLTDQENSNSAEAMETCDENGEPSVAELIESMDVTELVETPKELLDCGIDEDISMDGIELCAATEDLMNALDSPSVLTSENTNDDKTDLDSNALIEDLPLETSEPPEILLKEDESKMSSKSQRFPKESESSRENGDIAIETTQVSESAVDSSQTVG